MKIFFLKDISIFESSRIEMNTRGGRRRIPKKVERIPEIEGAGLFRRDLSPTISASLELAFPQSRENTLIIP